MKGSLKILEPGFYTTIQDGGRFGYRKYGVPPSGVLDEHASKIANWLVGNPEHAPVLEMTLKGGVFEFISDAYIAVTGAKTEVRLNQSITSMNKTLKVAGGDMLHIGRATEGCRIYLAIWGQWELKEVLGSYSTYVTAGMGGLNGKPLTRNDFIQWKMNDKYPEIKETPKKWLPHFSSKQRIRFLPGPEWEMLSNEVQEEFQQTEFEISTQSNRMGIRLKSQEFLLGQGEEISSSSVLPGMIQLPKQGNPIILMKDAQSVGGYPRIAKVIDADIWRLGQVWPPTKIKFERVDLSEAIAMIDYQKNILS